MKTAIVVNPEDAIRVLKIGKCPTLSAKSTLTYDIGCNARSEIQIRIRGNTGNGFFNDDWVSLEAIQQQLEKGKPEDPITSFALHPIFRGRSSNTPSFHFAVLMKEGLVQRHKDKTRCYARLDPKAFIAEVKGLMASNVSLKVPEPLVIAKPKAADTKAIAVAAVAPVAKPQPKSKTATPPKATIRGKQFIAAKKPAAKSKRK